MFIDFKETLRSLRGWKYNLIVPGGWDKKFNSDLWNKNTFRKFISIP